MSYIKNILALKIPLFTARYHSRYLFWVQKFNNSLRIITVCCLTLSAHPLVDIKGPVHFIRCPTKNVHFWKVISDQQIWELPKYFVNLMMTFLFLEEELSYSLKYQILAWLLILTSSGVVHIWENSMKIFLKNPIQFTINIFNSPVRKCFDLNYLTICFVSQINQFELILNAHISPMINNVSIKSIKSCNDQ